MNTTTQPNEPAVPHVVLPVDLRDYFAAKALAALIAKDNKQGAYCGKTGVPILSRWSYEYADAMLKARQS